MHVVVIGPMSSGCRLLRRILNASPHIICWLDTSHGTNIVPIENGNIVPKNAKVIVILRDPEVTEASREHRWGDTIDNIPYEASMEGINSKYPTALVVKYEELCANPKAIIEQMAKYLGVPVWEYTKRIHKSKNKKWLKEDKT